MYEITNVGGGAIGLELFTDCNDNLGGEIIVQKMNHLYKTQIAGPRSEICQIAKTRFYSI